MISPIKKAAQSRRIGGFREALLPEKLIFSIFVYRFAPWAFDFVLPFDFAQHLAAPLATDILH